MEFLAAILKVSEKAANVARTIRQEEHLFKLLVQQKDVAEANPRFVDDFKTLADVLIQEMVKHDLGIEFPGIKDRIYGEESNVFCNRLGEEITVEIKNDLLDTAELLETVLNGDKQAAILLAEEVHKSISLEEINAVKCDKEFSLDIDRTGIWIDPIDSTAEYINAKTECQDDISTSGLNCVTILIGAFDIDNGEPVLGVINQPFSQFEESRWTGESFWGVSTPSIRISSLENTKTTTKNNKACLSSSEDETVKTRLKSLGYDLVEAAGAGYKILNVIKGQADLYILSRSSTYKWDTCGPQAVLRSIGGDIISYEEARKSCGVLNPIRYGMIMSEMDDNKNQCNSGGLIAFRDSEILKEVMKQF